MTKKIISVLALVLMLVMTSVTSFATEGEVLPQAEGEETAPQNVEGDIIVKSVDYDIKIIKRFVGRHHVDIKQRLIHRYIEH